MVGFQVPPGVVDPIFEHELALELGMTVGELHNGRGTPMSAHELSVRWPLFRAYQVRQQKRAEEQAERQGRR
jgi:hypothetical protein